MATNDIDLRVLNQVARIATQDLELRPMLQRVADALRENFGWEFVAIASVDLRARRFVCEGVSTDLETGAYPGYGRELGSGVVGEVALTGKPILLDDVGTFPNYVETLPGARSELCVPVRHSGRVLGVINLESVRPSAFAGQLPLLETVSEQLAGAYAAARLIEETRRRSGHLKMLSDLSRAAMETSDLRTLLDRITDYVQRRFGFSLVAIVLADRGRTEFELMSSAGEISAVVRPGARWAIGAGIVGRTFETAEPQLVRDVRADPDYVPVHPDVVAQYAVPLRHADEVFGVINHESTSADAFPSETLMVLWTIAEQISGAVAAARSLEETKRRAEHLAVLGEISRAATEESDVDALLDRVAAWVQQRFSLSLVAIILVDEKREFLELRAFAGTVALTTPKGTKVPAGTRGVVGRAFRTGETQLVPDVTKDPDYMAMSEGVSAELAIPIRHRGGLLGVVNLESDSAAAFSPENAQVLRTIVDQVAGAIHLAATARGLADANARLRELFGRYVAPELVEVLLNDPGRLWRSGATREATVMFADIRGFTDVSQRVESGALVALLNEYYTRMGEVVFRHKGSINRLMGDGLLAVFGVPEALAEHREAGVRAALDMLEVASAFSPQWQEVAGIPLRIVVALNAGPLVAGPIGDPRHMEFMLLGDVVNVAARLEAEAKLRGAEVLISESVRTGLTESYEIEPLGDVELRGRAGSVAIHRVLRPGAVRG